MSQSQSSLLWVSCDGLPTSQSRRPTLAVKQHVMRNFLDKKRPVANRHMVVPEKRSTEKPGLTTQMPFRPPGCLSPTPALICDKDRIVYHAAWWHQYAEPQTSNEGPLPWQHKNKQDWNTEFWKAARLDETLLEVFICLAAVKEATIKDSQDARAYYRHKGKAIALVSEDVRNEGYGLRAAAIAAVCLLSQIAFVEGDYKTAETHCRALHSVMSRRSERLPGAVRQFLVGTDLRLTGIFVRAPLFPQQLHPNFRFTSFADASNLDREEVYSNLQMFPSGALFPEKDPSKALHLLYGLHQLAKAHSRTDITWTTPWGHINAVAYLLAELQVQAESRCSLEEKIALVGCQMHFWGMTSAFVPQSGIQSHQLGRLAQIIDSIDPIELGRRWFRATGNLNLLPWILTNAVVSALHCPIKHRRPDERLPKWLLDHTAHAMKRLSISTADELEVCLRDMPFTEAWNGIACRYFDGWMRFRDNSNTLASNSNTHVLADPSLFKNLRLNFDVSSDI